MPVLVKVYNVNYNNIYNIYEERKPRYRLIKAHVHTKENNFSKRINEI